MENFLGFVACTFLPRYMATTFSAAAYARKIFPCFDEPAFKAEFHLAISNRNNFITLANTKVSEVETQEL